MKAVLTQERFSDPDWIFERKLDGIRCIAIRDGGPVRLLSRNDLSLERALPGRRRRRWMRRRARASRSTARSSPSSDGQTSFQRLGHPGAAIVYYVFDVLWLDGRDVRGLPLRERKALLRDALSFDEGPLRLTAYRNEAGEAMFEEACRKGWEGVIAKRADSVYTAVALARLAEVQVRAGPGARDRRLHRAPRLARGVRRAARGRLRRRRARCATPGKVGTGFDRATAARRWARGCARCAARSRRSPTPRASATRPGSSRRSSPRSGSRNGRRAGRLRHPRFLGLRDDKAARSVVREAP